MPIKSNMNDNNVSSFICPICGKEFTRLTDYTEHLNVHLAEEKKREAEEKARIAEEERKKREDQKKVDQKHLEDLRKMYADAYKAYATAREQYEEKYREYTSGSIFDIINDLVFG